MEVLIVAITFSVLNLLALLFLIKKTPTKELVEKIHILNEYVALSQRQIQFVSAQSEATSKRVEAVEKILSMLLVSGSGGGGTDEDIMH